MVGKSSIRRFCAEQCSTDAERYSISDVGLIESGTRAQTAPVLGKCCGSEEKLYSINTPLTTSNLRIRASPAFQKTLINTVDVYVFYFQSTFNFPSWTSRVRSPSPALCIKEVMLMRNKEMKAALETFE